MFQSLVANIMLQRPNDQAIKLYKVCSLNHDRVSYSHTVTLYHCHNVTLSLLSALASSK